MKKILNILLVALGFLCIAVGSIGIFLPVLPTTPLYLLALLLFAKGSKRFHKWFTATGLYERYLADYAETHSMTMRTKIRVLLLAGVFEAFGFWKAPLPGRIGILVLAAIHWWYFFFRIKTRTKEEDAEIKSRRSHTPPDGS